MKVTVIIPTLAHKNTQYLKLCVESLRSTVDWDIIVVSNGDSVKPDYSHIFGITNHIHTRDQGQCNAVNIGAQVATPNTDYLFVSNDDMYFAPEWLKDVELEPVWPLVWSPNLLEPVDNAGSAEPFLKVDGGNTIKEFKQDVVDEFVASNEDEETTNGFNFPVFIKKEVWDTIGGYDIEYDPWGSNSDTDLQTLIEIAGIQPLRLRDVVVYHFSNKSGTFDGTHQEEWRRNFDYYTNKFGYNRDTYKCNTWMAENMVDWDNLKFTPEWEGKYKDK